MAANEPGALWMPNNNGWSGRNGLQPRYIVVHGTAGGSTAENTAAYFKSIEGTLDAVSSHYIVGRDGTVIQCIAEEDSAWANGIISGAPGTSGDGIHHDPWWDTAGVNPNMITISIEHVKPSQDNSDSLTVPQQASSFALIKHICERWGIPARQADALGGITGHFSIDPISRSRCPGPYPFDALWQYLPSAGGNTTNMLQLTDPLAVAYFKDEGSRGWYCPHTGHYIGGAILDFYRSIQGAPRLPLSDEIKDIPNYPEVAYQLFECGMIIFDPNHHLDAPAGFGKCYMVKFIDPLVQHYLVQPVKDQLANALAQVKTLQQQLQNATPQLTDLNARLTQINDLSHQLESLSRILP